MRKLIAPLVSFTVLVAGARGQPGEKNDLERIQGEWRVVGAERSGVKLTDEEIKKIEMVLVITAKKMSVSVNGKTSEASFTLDAAKKPKQIDTVDLDGGQKGRVTRGIYALDGDTLKMCMRDKEDGRPEDFSAPANSNNMLVILKRHAQ